MPGFHALWANHPSNQTPPENQPCKDAHGNVPSSLENQCAIRLGIALKASGVSLRSFTGRRCWFGHGHLLNAQPLADWIDVQASALGFKRRQVFKPGADADLAGKRGIVFCQNFWGTGNQGDHIDLWDGARMAHGSSDYFRRSQQVWFWEALA